jgi:phage tail sheath protein FI
VAHPWFATAGYNRGIVNCIRARIPLDQESRDLLYPGRINPIATFSDVGTVIWGNRNLQVRSSALDRLNIRRLLLQARKLIVAVANRLLFDPNDAQIRSQFLSLVNPILDNIRRERGLTDFRVSLVNEVEDNDRNTLRGKIFIKPTPTLEFIELEFTVTPTSVSFDSIL